MAADRYRPVRYLTAALAGPVLAAAGFAALAAVTGNAWFVLLAGACAGLVVAALSARHRLTDVTVALTGPARLAVGETVTHRLHVHNESSVTSAPLVATVATTGLRSVRVHVGRLPPGGHGVADLVRTGTARGVAEVVTVDLESGAPLGILATRLTRSYAWPLVVHPEVVAPASLVAGGGAAQESVDPVPGVGLDVAGIRDWRPGDEQRLVHWRSTARRGRLVVVERGTGPAPALHVTVVGPSGSPDWEAVLATAAATLRTVQLDGGEVAVTAWEPVGPAAPVSAGSPVDLLDWWSQLGWVVLPEPADLVGRLGGHATARSLVVVAPAQVPAAWWEQVRRRGAVAGLTVTALKPAPVLR